MTEREELEFDIAWEKRAKKIILICSAICGGLGLIIGVVIGIKEGGISLFVGGFLGGLWIGTGLGGAISLVPRFFRHQIEAHDRGGEKAEEHAITFNFIMFFFLLFAGPLGLLIRVLRINHRIKDFEEQLSALG